MVFGMATNCIRLDMSSNRCPDSGIFNFGNNQKSQSGAISWLHERRRNCLMCFAKNCCTRFVKIPVHYPGEEASRASPKTPLFLLTASQSFKNFMVKLFVDRLTSRSIIIVHNTSKSTWTWYCSAFDVLFWSWIGWKLPPLRPLFCFGIITVNLRYVTGNDLLSTSSSLLTIFKLTSATSDLPRAKLGWIYHTRQSFPSSRLEFSEYRDHCLFRTQLNDDLVQSQLAQVRYFPVLSCCRVGQNADYCQQTCDLLWTAFICVLFIHSPPKTFCFISIVSAQLVSSLNQNLIQIRCSHLSRKRHAACELIPLVDNHGNWWVLEKSMVTLVCYKCRLDILVLSYGYSSVTFDTHLVLLPQMSRSHVEFSTHHVSSLRGRNQVTSC